jgi:putative flippase GtrA
MIKSLLRFGGTGGVSFAINVGLTAFLCEIVGVSKENAFAISLAVVFTINFIACRYFVFEGRTGNPQKQLLVYLLSSLFFRGAEYLGFLLVHSVLDLPYIPAIFTVLLISFLLKFSFYKMVVFS